MMNSVSTQDRSFDNGGLGNIRSWMQRNVDDRKLAGCSMLMAHKSDEVFFHAAGQRSREKALPYTRDTATRIYSMTKPITSAALMMLVERGLVHLEAPVSRFIPAFETMQALIPGAEHIDQTEPAPSPTLHQLMTHTSGLSYPFNPGILARAMDAQDLIFGPRQGRLADMVDQVAKLPLAFQPGSRWEYSVATDVLGRVVEIISGKPLDVFFSDAIFEPLGMTETSFSVPMQARDRFASLYTPLAGDAMALNEAKTGGESLRLVDEAETSPFLKTEMHSGGGGLISTIDDYMNFTEMLRQGGTFNAQRLLSTRIVDFMMQNHLPGDIASMGPQSFAEQPMEGMGFGLGGAIVLDPARVGTPGSVGDFSWGGMASTFFWVDREKDLSVVFFTQLSPSSSYPLRAEMKALVHGAMVG
ncbi:serine hydrolase domain-containing protein [Shimia gijangensis]|nr:serine hydrolase domain-containing protein [Shimia gijangensis]